MKPLATQPEESQKQTVPLVPKAEDFQPYNVFTDLYILEYHTDIVQFLMPLDQTCFISAGDDCNIVIWNVDNGSKVKIIDENNEENLPETTSFETSPNNSPSEVFLDCGSSSASADCCDSFVYSKNATPCFNSQLSWSSFSSKHIPYTPHYIQPNASQHGLEHFYSFPISENEHELYNLIYPFNCENHSDCFQSIYCSECKRIFLNSNVHYSQEKFDYQTVPTYQLNINLRNTLPAKVFNSSVNNNSKNNLPNATFRDGYFINPNNHQLEETHLILEKDVSFAIDSIDIQSNANSVDSHSSVLLENTSFIELNNKKMIRPFRTYLQNLIMTTSENYFIFDKLSSCSLCNAYINKTFSRSDSMDKSECFNHFGNNFHVNQNSALEETTEKTSISKWPNRISCTIIITYQDFKLLVAGMYKCIKIWALPSGKLLQIIKIDDNLIKCLHHIPETNLFCSGGRELCLWNIDGKPVVKLQQNLNSCEDIHLMSVVNNFVITATDNLLAVYQIITCKCLDIKWLINLPPHIEKIQCLIAIQDSQLVSASLDGAIIVWSTNIWEKKIQLDVTTFQINKNEKSNSFPCSVQALTYIKNDVLIAAINCGFIIYDLISKMPVTYVTYAHHAKILHLQLIYSQKILATASEDGSIRLWGFPLTPLEEHYFYTSPPKLTSFMDIIQNRSKISDIIAPQLLGECLGHTGAIKMILDLEDIGFASCGTDKLVIIWKDKIVESERKDKQIQKIMGSTLEQR